MGLLSFFRRGADAASSTNAAPARKRGGKAQAQASDHAEQVQQLRQRARHRLIGAAVLVGVGIVAFPLVFETQPRPVPMDLPIVIPSQDGPQNAAATPARAPALPASLPPAAQAQAVDEPEAADAGNAPEASPEVPAAKPNVQAAPKVAPKAPEPAPKAADTSARYVVQVGAFADKKSAQDARQRLERKGLKTYAQVAQTPDGERIRVRLGPFSAKAEADKAAAAAQSVGLAGKVLTL